MPRLVSQLVPYWAKEAPQAVALSEAARCWTYAQLNDTIVATADVLRRAGAVPGDRVLLVCENGSAAVAIYFACTVLRVWPAIVNARLTEREIEEIRQHCQPRLVVFATDGSVHALRHAQHYRARAELSGPGGLMIAPTDREAICATVQGDPEEDVAALMYTSGTTGKPKGVMLSHRNLLFAALGAAKVRRVGRADRVLSVLPICHILGLSGVLLGSLACGAEVQLLARFDPAALLEKIENAGTTILIGTPAMYSMLAEYAARKTILHAHAPALRIVSTAGAPLDPATKARTEAVLGQPLRNGYGITECSPTITLGDIDAPSSDLTIGRALDGIETRVVNACGSDVAPGEVGELWVRGPGVMKGYYRAPDETARVLDDEGWFRTGDLVRCSNETFTIIGRNKEMLIRFGFNVYPAEIEAVLAAHPKVAHAAVVGRSNRGDEDIAAFVELRGGEMLHADELGEYTAGRLASYKWPSAYIVVDKLPRSPAGKVLKSVLAAQIAREPALQQV